MGNQFFHIGEEKAENGVDVADAFRRLAEELRGNPNGQEARQKALSLLRRKDINGVLGETRVEWLKKDISNLQDTESIQTFLVNSSRYMEKEGIAKLSWENLSKYLGQLDQPAQEADADLPTDGNFTKAQAEELAKTLQRALGVDVTVFQRPYGDFILKMTEMPVMPDGLPAIAPTGTVGGKANYSADGVHGYLFNLSKKHGVVWHKQTYTDRRPPTLSGFRIGLSYRRDQPAAGSHATEGDFSKSSSPIINDPNDKRKQSEIAKDMPDSIKLKDSHPQDIESHWTEMDERQRTRVAKEAGFNEVESRALAKLAWEGLDPTIKKDLSWVLNAPPEHLPGKDDAPDVGESDEAKEAQEDLDLMIQKEMDAAVQSFAEARASESWSTATDGMKEDFGDNVHATAEFGEWLAVNGALVMPGKDIPQPPSGFKKTDFGGAIPDFEVEVQMEAVKDFLARELKFPIEMVERVAQQQKYGETVIVKVSGKSAVFAQKDDPILAESVEEFQKGGWSRDREDSVWHKMVGKKSGAAFPAHMDAYGKYLWSVYDGSKLVARGEERTDKEAMEAADEHLQPEPVPVGEAADASTLHAQLAAEAKKAVSEADPFDIEAAIYWFASDNYSGMGDPLYGVLSLSKFKPGPSHRSVEDEGETAAEIYNHLKSKFAKHEADEPKVNVRPMTLDPKTKRQANAYLSELSKKYWPGVPLFDIAETMKEKFGIEVEEGLVTGEQGRDTFELKKGGMPIKNSMLALSWFKMPVSGKYEVTAYLSE